MHNDCVLFDINHVKFYVFCDHACTIYQIIQPMRLTSWIGEYYWIVFGLKVSFLCVVQELHALRTNMMMFERRQCHRLTFRGKSHWVYDMDISSIKINYFQRMWKWWWRWAARQQTGEIEILNTLVNDLYWIFNLNLKMSE